MMISREKKIWIYKKMNEIRQFELAIVKLFEENRLRGSVHLYVGEEAIASTVCSFLGNDDYIASTHRGHGHCIAKGAEFKPAMAELMGKDTGYCRGRSGSMHIADFSKGNLGANAIVAGGMPIAVGAALSIKLQNKNNVAVSFFGDSASNQGVFHESLNLAAVWKLPIVFICENNGYGISVPQSQSTSVKDISVRAKSYGIPGYTVDGNDVYAIYPIVEKAIERAKNGEGPTLIECKTYRFFGHWIGDPQLYRTQEEVNKWKNERDPIALFEERLLKEESITKEELNTMVDQIKREVDEAVKFAAESPEPDPAHVMDDVFYEGE